MKYKLSYLIILLLGLLLITAGCKSKDCPPEKIIVYNNTIIINNTEIELREIEVEKLVEVEKPCVRIREYDSTYVSNLVYQIKRCERQLEVSNNLTICSDDVIQCKRNLNKSETKLQELRDTLS